MLRFDRYGLAEVAMIRMDDTPAQMQERVRTVIFDSKYRVDSALRSFLSHIDIQHPGLRDAAEYAVLVGGKRLRPVLSQMMCCACGSLPEHSIHAASSVELVHCFSLVHDDLPALDNDTLRRGQPTLHVKFGEPMAILVGDLLLSLAHEMIAMHHAPLIAHRLSHELSIATREMIEGQVIDTLGEVGEQNNSLESLELMHSKKTGALLIAAARMGAICASSTQDHLDAATMYAKATGLMFQIVDDLLDVECSTNEIGKTAGKDKVLGKLTFPSLLGIDGSRSRVKELVFEAEQAARRLPHMQEELAGFARVLATRTY